MTRQLANTISYQGGVYQRLCAYGENDFDPRLHGFDPQGTSTALHRGWYGEFSAQPRLRLDELHIQHRIEGQPPVVQRLAMGPRFNGVAPVRGRFGCNSCYRDLQLPVAFSGGMLVARDYDVDLGGRYGTRIWFYREAHELIYRNGRLLEAIDHADTIALVRERHLDPDAPRPLGQAPVDLDPRSREALAARFRFPYRSLL